MEEKNAIGDLFLKSGCMLPITHINYAEYAVFIEPGQKSIPQGWKPIMEWRSFNLRADDDNSLWAVSLDDLERWNVETYQGKEVCLQENVFDINDNPLECYHAIRYNVPAGKYEVTVIGLRNEADEKQYGFAIVLMPVDEFVENADASETNFHEMFNER